jgi:hypothetical protein
MTSTTGRDALAGALGAPPPSGVAKLAAADLHHLAAAVEAAAAEQSRSLRRAMDGALAHLPRLLRGPVKALLR